MIEQCNLERPALVGWSYGGFVICDYLRAYGDDAISAINLVGAAVTLNERFDDIGPAFLANAPAGADPDLPTRITALRRFWHAMTAGPLDPAELETGLCGSISVPPQVLGALISRQIDSDDVLSRLGVPVLVTHGRRDQIVLPSMAEHILRACPTATASWYDGAGHAPFIEDPNASTESSPRLSDPEQRDVVAACVSGGGRQGCRHTDSRRLVTTPRGSGSRSTPGLASSYSHPWAAQAFPFGGRVGVGDEDPGLSAEGCRVHHDDRVHPKRMGRKTPPGEMTRRQSRLPAIKVGNPGGASQHGSR